MATHCPMVIFILPPLASKDGVCAQGLGKLAQFAGAELSRRRWLGHPAPILCGRLHWGQLQLLRRSVHAAHACGFCGTFRFSSRYLSLSRPREPDPYTQRNTGKSGVITDGSTPCPLLWEAEPCDSVGGARAESDPGHGSGPSWPLSVSSSALSCSSTL